MDTHFSVGIIKMVHSKVLKLQLHTPRKEPSKWNHIVERNGEGTQHNNATAQLHF